MIDGAGLKSGQQVVSEGNYNLPDGAAVVLEPPE